MALRSFTRTYHAGGARRPGEAISTANVRQALFRLRQREKQAIPAPVAAPAPAPAPAPAAPAKPVLSKSIQEAYQRAMEQYRPGGGFGVGTKAMLERRKKKTVAAGQQALTSAGLAGTTMLAAPGQRFEEETAVPALARVEEERAMRLSGLEIALAEAEQRGYESAEERALRSRLASGQLGLGYAQLGAQTGLGYAQIGLGQQRLGLGQQQLGFQREQFESGQVEKDLLARLALQRQTRSQPSEYSQDYSYMTPMQLSS